MRSQGGVDDRPIAQLRARDFGMRSVTMADVAADGSPTAKLIEECAQQLWREPAPLRFILLHGLVPAIRGHAGMPLDEAVAWARHSLRELVDALSRRLAKELEPRINPLQVPLKIVEYGIDGFNPNRNYEPAYEGIEVRDGFVTTKCLHFDAAEPLATNIYGPNSNITGGLPVVADVQAYCRDRGVPIGSLLCRLPGYPVGIAAPHYQRLIEGYAIAFHVDMMLDTPCLITLNDIEMGGIAHGATRAAKQQDHVPASRPLWHIAFDYAELRDVDRWYRRLGLGDSLPEGEHWSDPRELVDGSYRPCSFEPLKVRPG